LCERLAVIDLSTVQNLLASWWFEYDQGHFDIWPDYFTDDAHFTCRSDLGNTEHEAFFRADLRGRDAVVAWQVDHRRNSPYPLRHNNTNVHVTSASDDETEFRSYLFVTKILQGTVSNVATGLAVGRLTLDGDAARIAELAVILDFAESQVFDSVVHPAEAQI
jgi:hypothetical protein